MALVLVLIAVLTACLVRVTSGSAKVITRFGKPVRVVTEPGLAWRLPPPIDREQDVDLRLHTTSSGTHGVLTKDGLSVEIQAFVAWRVPAEPERIIQFMRAVGNQPAEAATQLQSYLGSALETVTSRFELKSLLNTDASQVELGRFEDALQERLTEKVLAVYGIQIEQVGIERLGLPQANVAATIERMSAERTIVAERKKALGRERAGEIRATADKERRIALAQANTEASQIRAAASGEVAAIEGRVQAQDPQLYTFVRSLDTLEQVITNGTRIILRTDAAPFSALVSNPASLPGASSAAPPAASGPTSSVPPASPAAPATQEPAAVPHSPYPARALEMH